MLLRARGSLFVCLAGIGAVLMCIGYQTSPQARTGDLGNYANATPDLGFPQPAPTLLAYRDAQDIAAMRRHGWQIWAAMTQLTRSGFPIFFTWYQASEVFGERSVQARRMFAPEFRVPSQKTLGDSDAIPSFNVYNGPLRDHVRQHGYQHKATLAALIGTAADVQSFPEAAMAVKTVWWPVRGDSFTALWEGAAQLPVVAGV
jgi:hypothetical protein